MLDLFFRAILEFSGHLVALVLVCQSEALNVFPSKLIL